MRCFVIVLPNDINADKQYIRFMTQAKKFKWDVERFDAIIGKNLKTEDFTNAGLYIKPGSKISKRPGALGCFMSHWTLWHKCVQLNEDCTIFESDAYITGPMPELDLSTYLVKWHLDVETKHSDVSGQWSKHAHAYSLSPKHAQMLIDGAISKNVKPADVMIGDAIVPWKHYEVDLIPQKKIGPSTTAR